MNKTTSSNNYITNILSVLELWFMSGLWLQFILCLPLQCVTSLFLNNLHALDTIISQQNLAFQSFSSVTSHRAHTHHATLYPPTPIYIPCRYSPRINLLVCCRWWALCSRWCYCADYRGQHLVVSRTRHWLWFLLILALCDHWKIIPF